MNEQEFPSGWDKERIGRVLRHYEGQTEDEAMQEDEAAMAAEATETRRAYLLHVAETSQGAQFGLAALAIAKLSDADLEVLYEELIELQRRAQAQAG